MKITPLIFLVVSFLFFGCKKLVEAPQDACFIPYIDFVAHHVDPNTLEVSFTSIVALNGTIATHEWDFGDGTTFTGPNPPPHRYPAQTPGTGAGNYKVKYRVTNECGEAYWTKEIKLNPCLPNVSFTHTFINDSTVSFTNTSTSASTVSYIWTFGDGSTVTNPPATFTRNFSANRSYTVALKGTNNCGENFFTANINICRKPVPAQTITNSGCGQLSINAGGTRNGALYQWDFGNGVKLPATPSASSSINYTYPAAGNYTITLKVLSQGGCDSATISNPVTIQGTGITPNNSWSYQSDDLEYTFSRAAVTGATSYSWNFGDNTTSNQQNPGTKTYSSPGVYTLTLTASNACNNHSFTETIRVPYYNALPNAPSGFREVIAFSPGQIYYLATNGRLYRSDTAGNWSGAINLPSRLSFNEDTRLYRDPSNNLWIYGRNEVARFNMANQTWTSFYNNTGLDGNTTINGIAVDPSGTLWVTSDREIRRGNTRIALTGGGNNGNHQFTGIVYDASSGRMVITSSNRSNIYTIPLNGTQLTTTMVPAIIGGSRQIMAGPGNDLLLSTTTGILRINSSGSVVANYNVTTTGGLLVNEPTTFQMDNEGNIWAVNGGRLIKIPISSPGAARNYSYTSELGNLSTFTLLNLSGTNNDILLAKSASSAVYKIR